ncbi:MAG TPA: AbiV family abortive infection protein [Puia sp.]|nr:AbiV family abortive infection protein [Puia sp.]
MELKRSEIIELFSAAIDNAYYLYKTAMDTTSHLKNKKYPSLGLAELALEELGKSYSCLSYYSKSETTEDWKIFWKEWKNHELKAHRAFFYEFFSLTRIEIDFADKVLPFPASRGSFLGEKEAAFYVDIDRGNRKIHRPDNEITNEECIRRVMSLVGLFSAAFYVRDWMTEATSEDSKNAISDFAYLAISTKMYLQDVFTVLKSMRINNSEYNKGLDKIKDLFTNVENKPE